MEGGESILDGILEEENLYDDDIDMVDVEEGELVESNSQILVGENSAGDVNIEKQETGNKNKRRRNKKKKSKRKKGIPGPNVTDINRFVIDVCKRLKEKKSYLVWTAVACLGVSALSDIVKEVDAIQACGGQKTADGRRYRTGGGILWGIIKVRDPKAYKEIMRKGNEFEKGFNKQNKKQTPAQSHRTNNQSDNQNTNTTMKAIHADGSDETFGVEHVQPEPQQSDADGKRVSVHDRIRVPVAYDDSLLYAVDDLRVG